MNVSKFLITTGAFLLLAIVISACSVQVQNEEKVAVASKDVAGVGTAHTHPSNECTNSITHTHILPGGSKVHKHAYSCKGKAPKSANSHAHPANKCTRSTTHTHQNGKRAHSHKYACQAKARTNNAHVHSANSMTRSKRHVHPAGNRKHSHHYSR